MKAKDNIQMTQQDILDAISINLTRIESLNDIVYSLLEQVHDVKLVNQLYPLNHSINELVKDTSLKIEQNYFKFSEEEKATNED